MAASQEKSSSPKEINGDLIRRVADQVYKMLMLEARTDYERRRITRSYRRQFGGR